MKNEPAGISGDSLDFLNSHFQLLGPEHKMLG
jgi:hypothetical protein